MMRPHQTTTLTSLTALLLGLATGAAFVLALTAAMLATVRVLGW